VRRIKYERKNQKKEKINNQVKTKGRKEGRDEKERMIPSSPFALTQKGEGHGEKKESKRGEGMNEKKTLNNLRTTD
jgi:hypothetical protein